MLCHLVIDRIDLLVTSDYAGKVRCAMPFITKLLKGINF